MDERGKKSKLESMHFHSKDKLDVIVDFGCIEGVVFLLGYIAASGRFQIGESNEGLAYGIGTAALMGIVGWSGIRSYINIK